MELLEKENYYKVAAPLSEVVYNHLFAKAVIDQKVDGLVYVDCAQTPTSYYIVHPYGMSLLFGNWKNEQFNNQLIDYLLNKKGSRQQFEWMQVYPEVWSDQLELWLGDHLITKKKINESGFQPNNAPQIEEQTRVNFKFNLNKYKEFRTNHPNDLSEVFRSSEDEFFNMPGTVVPKFFWKNASHFIREGIGFSLRQEEELASTAFAVFIEPHQLELGIESAPHFRGKGFAMLTCTALIEYCLKNNYEPIWSCRLENTGSYLLAQKLGFDPVRFHPFYKLNV